MPPPGFWDYMKQCQRCGRLVDIDNKTMKQIGPSDVAFVIPRIDWTNGEIYDMYDDQYSTEVQGMNLINGGYGNCII